MADTLLTKLDTLLANQVGYLEEKIDRTVRQHAEAVIDLQRRVEAVKVARANLLKNALTVDDIGLLLTENLPLPSAASLARVPPFTGERAKAGDWR